MGIRTSRDMQEQVRKLASEGHGIRRITAMTGLSRNTVRSILRDLPEEPAAEPKWADAVDWERVCAEHGRGRQIKTLHQEHAPEITYMKFWHEYRSRFSVDTREATIRLSHQPGERTYFDFCDGIPLHDGSSGKLVKTQLLVAVLPFSSRTEAEFVSDQKQPTFMRAMERAFARLGGVTPYIVVDNLKSAVVRAHLYDPDVNRTFVEFANHMGFAVLPARPYKPRDKAAVEAAIGVIQRQFFDQVRNQKFYSLSELNERLSSFLVRLNSDPMKDHGGVSRLERFEAERPLLKALPPTPFEVSEWRTAKVHPDCHVQVERRFYSVPFQYVGLTVHVRIKQHSIEIFSEERDPLAVHPRLTGSTAKASTLDAHYPEEKVALARFDVQAALRSAERIGPHTYRLVQDFFACSTPLKFLRRAQGILRLHQSGQISADALEHASERALLFGKKQLAFIKDAASFYQARGAGSSSPAMRAPVRAMAEVFLHNQPPTEE